MAMNVGQALLQCPEQHEFTVAGRTLESFGYVASHLNAAAFREALDKPSRRRSDA